MATPVDLMPAPRSAAYSSTLVRLDAAWEIDDRSTCPGIAAAYRDLLAPGAVSAGGTLTLQHDASLPAEGYRLSVTDGSIEVAAESRRGFRHALATLEQLRYGPSLHGCEVEDHPRLPVRGVHLYPESVRQMDAAQAQHFLDTASRYKLNTVVLEMGERFPYQRHPAYVSPAAWTLGECRAVAARARELGIAIVPLVQSLGHHSHLIRHPEYADYAEGGEDGSQLCPLHPGVLQLWSELAEEILAVFSDATHLHLGGDETRELGHCDRCRPVAAEHGPGRLYVDHMNRVVEWTTARGLTPIIWDDILCARPETLERLDPRAEIMYWDYWTTTHPTPYITARYDRPLAECQTYDRRWDDEWRAELDTVTADMLAGFCKGVDLPTALGADFLARFRPYLGDGFPKHLTGFPYIEYFQDQGRRVYCAPSCSGNTTTWRGLPDFPRYTANIEAFAQRAIASGSAGLVTTAWYNRQPEVIDHGIMITGCTTW